MSIKIMSAVFESETLGPTERLIMLSLADHADDAGRCYPSIARLCQRTGLTQRTVQINIRKLQEQGYVTIVQNAGQGGSNVYFVTAQPLNVMGESTKASNAFRMPDAHLRFAIYRRDKYTCAYCSFISPDGETGLTLDHIIPQSRGGDHSPENLITACMYCNRKKKDRTPFEWLGDKCPPHLMPPAANAGGTKCTTPPHMTAETPAPDAPKPSGTIREASLLDPVRETPSDILAQVASQQAAVSFIAFRRQVKKPLTKTGAERLCKSLATIREQGGDPDDALGMAEERGWQSVKPEWYFKEQKNDRQSPRPDRRSAAADDAFVRVINAAAGTGRSS